MIKQLTLTRMRIERSRLGKTQQWLADELGVTQPRVSAWERGKVPVPKARRARIAELLHIGVDDLDSFVIL